MTDIHVDKVGEMTVVECEGRFVRSDEAFRLRDVVTAQRDAQVIVLDLTEMRAIGGGGIGVMVFLQRWCRDHDIRFKLFNPSRSVQERLENTNGRPTGGMRWLPDVRSAAEKTSTLSD